MCIWVPMFMNGLYLYAVFAIVVLSLSAVDWISRGGASVFSEIASALQMWKMGPQCH